MSKRKRSPIGDLRTPLSEDDEALWERTAETITPLKRAKPRHVAVPQVAPEVAPPPPARPRTAERQPARSEPKPPPPKAKTTGPAPVPVDRRKTRQLGSGRIAIEARIDLHGMRQSEAHATLRRFLFAAREAGRRWVLVITGKGAPNARDGEERGVLRRNVPRWLAEPELAAIVVSFTTASIRHGGDGALYVQIRVRKG